MVWEIFPESMPSPFKTKHRSFTDYLIYIAVGLTVVGAYLALSR